MNNSTYFNYSYTCTTTILFIEGQLGLRQFILKSIEQVFMEISLKTMR